MRISDWSSDVCSSDLVSLAMGAVRPCVPLDLAHRVRRRLRVGTDRASTGAARSIPWRRPAAVPSPACGRELRMRVAVLRGEAIQIRSEEHTSELQSLMRISYAVFCLKKKNKEVNTLPPPPPPSPPPLP